MTLSPQIRATCAEYFGRYHARTGKWSPPNRCDACPMRSPCFAFGMAPARTFAELDQAREAFEFAAVELLR